MRVAIVHYWLVSMRGGEKVLEALCQLFPEADIFTHVYDPGLESETIRRFNSEVQQRCIDDMAEHRGWGKGRGQGRKSPAAMRT